MKRSAAARDMTPGDTSAADDLRSRFLDAMSHTACTVNIITTDGVGGRAGVTISAMTSVSADSARPTLLVCVHQLSPASAAIAANGVFCVNILRDDQAYISDCFAGRYKTPDGDKFSCTSWVPQSTGAPRALDALVAFDCRLVSSQLVGSHYVFLGEVEDVFVNKPGLPLIYANRAYGTPRRHKPHTVGQTGADTLRVGVFHTFGPHLLPELLKRSAASAPLAQTSICEGDQQQLLSALRAGEIDLALLYDFHLGDGVMREPLADLQPYVLVSPHSPLASEDRLSLKRLAEEPMVLLDAPPSGGYFLSLFEARALKPLVSIRTQSLEMTRSMVAHGFGYALLATKPTAGFSGDGLPLTTRPLREQVTPSRLVVATRVGSHLGASSAAFVEVCRDVMATQSTRLFNR
jgi:flavin reductase (DIM6/NTAB) family NADH-FMN oxidoreductase RutF/DNA-binding transcriptional LysR family regulator